MLKLKYYERQKRAATLYFTAIPEVRTKTREKCKQEKKRENGYVKRKHTNIYPHIHGRNGILVGST